MAGLTPPAELVDRLAELAVSFGANLQPGQILGVAAELDHAPLVHAVAVRAYRAGALFVDVNWFDPHVKRARIAHAADDTLEFVPEWYGRRVLGLGEERAAYVSITGPTAPGLLDDLDPERVGRDRLPNLKETMKVINDRTLNWTIVPFGTPAWARLVHPEREPADAYEQLWQELAHVCRLDEDDPVAAWEERMSATRHAADALTKLRLDALRFHGPTVDLTIGLLPTSAWQSTTFETAGGVVHRPNLPSEEIFTTPDPERADGWVHSTKPLVFTDGSVARGLRVRFERGRAVEIEADEGAANLNARADADAGARRLGEVALVDREGRIGPLGTVFYDTLLDENAASHIALGAGFPSAVGAEDAPRVNDSDIHIDFMVGGDGVDVTGIRTDGSEVPVMRGGSWCI